MRIVNALTCSELQAIVGNRDRMIGGRRTEPPVQPATLVSYLSGKLVIDSPFLLLSDPAQAVNLEGYF